MSDLEKNVLESVDRNKTTLTLKVTTVAQAWLDEKGFKPIETEVRVADGWCADLAAVIDPTRTELVNLKLVPGSPSAWTRRPDWEELIKPHFRLMTCIVEVKTSRSDFCGDKKWKLISPSDLSYLAAPAGLVYLDEVPPGWGLLELKDGVARQKRAPEPRVASPEEQRDVIWQIAVRRDHHTRYERFRACQKEERIEQAQKRLDSRMRNLAAAVLAVAEAKHESLEECLSWYGVRKLSPAVIERLQDIYGIAKRNAAAPEAKP